MTKSNKPASWITKQSINFPQWYTDVCYHANLFEYGFVKGTIIFKPYALALWKNIQSYFQAKFHSLGVEEVYFPIMIPKSLFQKELSHITGFKPELATITKIGETKLEEELYIRPTSEVLMMRQFQKEIKSYRDLPLQYNQWCNVIRWEKNTRPFLRTSEFLWQEGHTAHETESEAKAFSLKILDLYAEFFEDYLNLPIIKGEKTENERFAGALHSYSIESMMPDGQALQCGTTHYFGQKFAKIFNVKFENKNQTTNYVSTTSWGISTRIIGAIIMSHGDDRGLVMPFQVAPTQIQIIVLNSQKQELKNYASQIMHTLEPFYRVQSKPSHKSFGFQIKQAEVQGIPFRIEIGFKNLENHTVTIARRDTNEKIEIKFSELTAQMQKLILSYSENLSQKALQSINKIKHNYNHFSDYAQAMTKQNILALVPFCCRAECEMEIQELTMSSSRCIPLQQKNLPAESKCFRCNAKAQAYVYFAKSY